MFHKITLAALTLVAAGATSYGAQIFTHNFTGGADSWEMAGGGLMTTADLTAVFRTSSGNLAPLITKVGGNTDARSATLMAWFNLSDIAAQTNLFTVTTSGDSIGGHYGYSLLANTNGGVFVDKTENATGVLATIPTSEWVHIALSVEPTAVASARTATALLYVNGVLWGGGTAASDLIFGTNFNGNGFSRMNVGGAGVSVGGLSVHDTVLSAADINAVYRSQSAIPEPSTYGLMGAGALAAVAVVRRRKRA